MVEDLASISADDGVEWSVEMAARWWGVGEKKDLGASFDGGGKHTWPTIR